jgi:hypothetical protein
VQAAPVFCHTPVASQVCGWFPLHWPAPGLHVTHDPLAHAGVLPEQAAPLPSQIPSTHSWGCKPSQLFSPVVQPASTDADALPLPDPDALPLLDPELLPLPVPELLELDVLPPLDDDEQPVQAP